jgi:hypothetical protein
LTKNFYPNIGKNCFKFALEFAGKTSQPFKRTTMPLQYLLDNSGKTTAFVIPITDWEAITRKHSDLKQLTVLPGKKKKPSDFAGILTKEEGEKMQQYLTEVRKQWDRDTY